MPHFSDFSSALKYFKESPAKAPVIWEPTAYELEQSHIGQLMQDKGFSSYEELHRWSVEYREGFWKEAIQRLKIRFEEEPMRMRQSDSAKNPFWLPHGRLNIAESCFHHTVDKPALVVGQEGSEGLRHVSYAELDSLSARVASGLIHQGFSVGDRFALYMPMCYESVAIYLGIVRAGMVVVSVADSFSGEELEKRCEMVEAKGVFTCDGYLYGGKELRVYEKVKNIGVPAVVVHRLGKDLLLREEDFFFDDFLGHAQFDAVLSEPYAETNILFSSGTTKTPKAIPWTHLTPIKVAMDGFFHQDIHPFDVVTWTTGMGWMMAPWLIYASLINKATMAVFVGATSGLDFGKFVEKTGVTVLGTIPSLVRNWRRSGIMEQCNWRVRVFSSTGEPSDPEDYLYLMSLAKFKAPVIEYCGGTEIGGGYITGTVVQSASPGTFTTPALGLDFWQNEDGEAWILPPSIGLSESLLNKDHEQEYYAHGNSGPNGEVLRSHGDAFERIEEGGNVFYKSVGRTDDAMNLGGVKVSAIEIEEVLNHHPSVHSSAAVIQRMGNGPGKLVVFYEGEEKEQLLQELQQLLSKRLNPLFRIGELRKVDALPVTASGKVIRKALRKVA